MGLDWRQAEPGKSDREQIAGERRRDGTGPKRRVRDFIVALGGTENILKRKEKTKVKVYPARKGTS